MPSGPLARSRTRRSVPTVIGPRTRFHWRAFERPPPAALCERWRNGPSKARGLFCLHRSSLAGGAPSVLSTTLLPRPPKRRSDFTRAGAPCLRFQFWEIHEAGRSWLSTQALVFFIPAVSAGMCSMMQGSGRLSLRISATSSG
jgi:hypothetical protein